MTVHQLLEYDAWATAELLQAVEALSPEQFTQEPAGPLSSVRQQFAHLLTVTDRYCARLSGEEVPDISAESFSTPRDLISYESQMRQRMKDFLDNLDESTLEQVHEHATRKGVFRASIEQTLRHMANHATYHRGQVACLLKLHGVDFPDTDIILWLNQQHS